MTTHPTGISVLAGTWTVDPGASTAAFHAVGIGGTKVRGTIPVEGGKVEVGGSGRPLSVDAVLDATRVDTANPRRDKDLRGKRFLKVATNPVIRFTGGVAESATGWTVEGTLAAAGAECPLTLDVQLLAGSPTDGTAPSRVRATGTIDLRSLGIKVPGFVIRRHVHLEIDAALRPGTR